jgi:hypothetical protein
MSDSSFIMIPMTYALPAKPLVSPGETALPLSLGFPVRLWPKRNDAAAFDWWGRCERASDLKLCPQKLRKGALKPLKQLVHVNLCTAWEALSTRRGKAEPAISSAFRPASRVTVSGRGRARRQDMPSRQPRETTKTDFIEHHHLRLAGER